MKRQRVRRFALLSLCLSLLAGSLAACAGGPGKEVQNGDILTQTVIPEGKIPVTVLVKYAFSIDGFEKAAEEKFPQLDIIQVGNYTSDRGLVEYERRLKHDDLTDIVMTWPIDVGEEYWADRLLDLSGMPFTSSYNTSMLNSIAKDGKLYYLPGPAQVRGIVYNKTLFAEKGWEVPQDFNGFVSLCQQIEASGMRSLQLGFGNSEVLDTAFVGYSYGNCFSTPQDAQWIADYNQGAGSFGDHFGSSLDTFEQMTQAGIWKPEDLKVTYAQRETMLFTRQCAMAEDSVLMTRMGYGKTGTTDEFALMPFFNPSTPSDWARLYMVCYIGLNKHLIEPQNQDKYNLILELMSYISSPEGQEALMSDTGAMYSSVRGVPAPDIPEIASLKSALEEGRYAIFPELKNAQNALREGLSALLSGTISREELIEAVDEQNRNPSALVTDEELGQATEDFSLIETGNFLTDAMRRKTGADVALFMDNGKDGKYNGKGVSGKIYKGPQTMADVLRIFCDLKQGEKGVLQTVTMTGADLISTLEYSIPVDNDRRGWFYYFSGLKMEFAPAAEPGNRVRKVTDTQGNPIDAGRLYTVAVMDQTVPQEYIKSMEDSGILIADLLAKAIREAGTISPSKDGRFTVVKP